MAPDCRPAPGRPGEALRRIQNSLSCHLCGPGARGSGRSGRDRVRASAKPHSNGDRKSQKYLRTLWVPRQTVSPCGVDPRDLSPSFQPEKMAQTVRALFRSFGQRLHALFSKEKDPERRARGLAVGLGVSMLPPFGGHMLLVLVLAPVFGASLPIALASVWVNNPWTFLPVFMPVYLAETKLGLWLMPRSVPAASPSLKDTLHMMIHGGVTGATLHTMGTLALPLLVGSLICALTVGLGAYTATHVWHRIQGPPLPPSQDSL